MLLVLFPLLAQPVHETIQLHIPVALPKAFQCFTISKATMAALVAFGRPPSAKGHEYFTLFPHLHTTIPYQVAFFGDCTTKHLALFLFREKYSKDNQISVLTLNQPRIHKNCVKRASTIPYNGARIIIVFTKYLIHDFMPIRNMPNEKSGPQRKVF